MRLSRRRLGGPLERKHPLVPGLASQVIALLARFGGAVSRGSDGDTANGLSVPMRSYQSATGGCVQIVSILGTWQPKNYSVS